jgi:hypothetical protein
MSMASVLGGPRSGVNDSRKRLYRFSSFDVRVRAEAKLKFPGFVPESAAVRKYRKR